MKRRVIFLIFRADISNKDIHKCSVTVIAMMNEKGARNRHMLCFTTDKNTVKGG
jgi:hypothetical protein